MTASENLRYLISLSASVRPAQLPTLYGYAASNRLYRATGLQLCSEASFDFRFGRFRVSANCGDLGTIGEIFVQQPYRQLDGFAPADGDVCVDVGANIGCVSLQWRLTNPTGRILAIEPHPETFARMTRNFALNAVAPIEAVHAAAGERDGALEMLIEERDSMARAVSAGSADIAPFEKSSTITIPCYTLDTLLAGRAIPHVDLLKIDVEGFEVECLRGAMETLGRTRRVVLEFHSLALRERCAELLTACGFSCEIRGVILFASRRPVQ